MEFICDICNFEAKSAASLGSHKRYKHGIKAKTAKQESETLVSEFPQSLVDRLEAIAERFEAVVDKLEGKAKPSILKCPHCQTELIPDLESTGAELIRGRFQPFWICPQCYKGR